MDFLKFLLLVFVSSLIIRVISEIFQFYLRNRWTQKDNVEYIECVIKYNEKQEKLLHTVTDIINQHSVQLAIRKRQLAIKDCYGVTNDDKWQKEIDRFIDIVITPVTGKPIDIYGDVYKKMRKLINEIDATMSTKANFNNELSPNDYEHFVAKILEDNGWETRVTKASCDQGIDIIASHKGKSIAIQCKLYNQSVGNSAVQEIIAGRVFENTDFAAVVSNKAYTPAAKQLAEVGNVLLLHHDELPLLQSRLSI